MISVRFNLLVQRNSKQGFSSGTFAVLLFLVLVLAFVANFPFASGEDVTNARTNFQSPQRNDFWGGFAPFFYSLIPNTILDSNTIYAFLYLALIGLGSFSIHRYLFIDEAIYTPLRNMLLLLLTLITALFTLQFSRDGTLLAFVWAGLGLFLLGSSKRKRSTLLPISLVLFVIGMSFRPWLGLSSIPLSVFLLARSNNFQRISPQKITICFLGILALVVAPVLVDRTAAKISNMEQSYPQQQVMIMDTSALACLSASGYTSNESLRVLSSISNLKNLSTANLCSSFYPQSWASVVFYQRSGPKEINPIRMINPSEQEIYETFSREWIRLILQHPKDYVQTKLMLSSQLLFAGDSRGDQSNFFQNLLMTPLSILRDLRLFSVLPFSLLLIIFTRIRRESKSKIETLSIQTFYLAGVFSVALAFIGDNQRYLIPICLLTSLLIIVQRHISQEKHAL